jgi:hypothetical protein
MHPLVAWLPFVAALLLAFVSGVVFARLNQSSNVPGEQPRRGAFFGLYGRRDTALITALVALLLATLFAWLVATAVLLRFLR